MEMEKGGCEYIETIKLDSGLQAEKKNCTDYMDGYTAYVYTFKNNGWWYQVANFKGEESTEIIDQMLNSFSFTR